MPRTRRRIPLVIGRCVRNSAIGDRTLGLLISIQAQISSESFLPFLFRRRIRNDPFSPVRWDWNARWVPSRSSQRARAFGRSIAGL